jgi:hypothetical protein
MSASIHSPILSDTDDLPVHLHPEAIERRLANLIRAYVHGRSSALALAVARHCEALLLHPAMRHQPERLEGLCHLASHWRLLSVQAARLAS